MKTICTKCGSEDIYIVQPEIKKEEQTQTLDEMLAKQFAPIPAIYITTTWACKKCGYSVSR